MKRSIVHLPLEKQRKIRNVTEIIVKKINPEKIILFGIAAISDGSIDHTSKLLHSIYSTYDILVVTKFGDRCYDYEVSAAIEKVYPKSYQFNIIVHDIGYLNNQLSEGTYFFSVLFREAILLYDAGFTEFKEPRPLNLPSIIRTAEKDFSHWSFRANNLYKIAHFSNNQDDINITAFLLHQVAESAYQAILLTYTGYKPTTHNLDKLRRYTNRFSIELATLFPRNTDYEDHLFKQLLQSYIDARYKDEFTISPVEIRELFDRIEKLLSITNRVCNNRLLTLKKMNQSANYESLM